MLNQLEPDQLTTYALFAGVFLSGLVCTEHIVRRVVGLFRGAPPLDEDWSPLLTTAMLIGSVCVLILALRYP